LGEGSLGDRAVGEDVEIPLGPATGVQMEVVRQPDGEFIVTATNDLAAPATFEATLPFQEVRSESTLGRRNGRPLWRVTIPANGRVTLRFRDKAPATNPA
jgi:hypothetical protein